MGKSFTTWHPSRGGRSGGRHPGRQGRGGGNNSHKSQYPPNSESTTLPQAFTTMNLQEPGSADWYMDIGATAHLHADSGTIKSCSNKCKNSNLSVLVGNESRIPVTKIGHSSLGLNPFRFNIKRYSYYSPNNKKILFMYVHLLVTINALLNLTNLVFL